ncbi:hypothetical protein Tco_1313353 [Tanacetum coccineum]
MLDPIRRIDLCLYGVLTTYLLILHMALPPRDQRHQYHRFKGLGYTSVDITDFEERLGISSVGDFLGTTPFYTSIRDLMRRLYHKLIACSIPGRSQAPKKVIVTDFFYLRGMDVGSINIPNLLARYLRLFALGRKREAMISGGKFVARLAKHFWLLTEERLQGLKVIIQDLPMIDMAELVRLQIYEELDDNWVWGGQAISAPVQAPQPPVAGPARTMAQRLARLEEDVHGMRGALGEQRDVLDSMAYDFSRFTTWTVT